MDGDENTVSKIVFLGCLKSSGKQYEVGGSISWALNINYKNDEKTDIIF